jgi:hypothetical protein
MSPVWVFRIDNDRVGQHYQSVTSPIPRLEHGML